MEGKRFLARYPGLFVTSKYCYIRQHSFEKVLVADTRTEQEQFYRTKHPDRMKIDNAADMWAIGATL